MIFEISILTALLLDMILGDPKWFPHPVRAIGKLCVFFEKLYRTTCIHSKTAGIATSLSVIIITAGSLSGILYLCNIIHVYLQTCISIVTIYFLLAGKDLFTHSKEVYAKLFPQMDIDAARIAISRIVGRDTATLSGEGISKACVETVAENMVDGITAPLFYAIVFSCFVPYSPEYGVAWAAIGITIYKTINTMDSMFGYKNERYLRFGWFPAKIDDAVNMVPARLSGLCVVAGSFLTGNDWKTSWKIFLQDRLQHASPNAGHTEAAVAGALGIQLGGTSSYFGKIVKKPTIGNPERAVAPQDILRANTLVFASSAIFLLVMLITRKLFLLSLLLM